MIHPHTMLKAVSDSLGVGVFATQLIPKGTIIFVPDKLDIVLKPGHPLTQDPGYRHYIEKYSFVDGNGNRVISWDHAKYVNHSCNPNTMCTAWGFDIAVTDILPGQEMTCEYGMLNIEHDMPCECGYHACRRVVHSDDSESLAPQWDSRLQEALPFVTDCEQPLKEYMTPAMNRKLAHYLHTGKGYVSVSKLQYKGVVAEKMSA